MNAIIIFKVNKEKKIVGVLLNKKDTSESIIKDLQKQLNVVNIKLLYIIKGTTDKVLFARKDFDFLNGDL